MKSYSFDAALEIIGINPYVQVPEAILTEIFIQLPLSLTKNSSNEKALWCQTIIPVFFTRIVDTGACSDNGLRHLLCSIVYR